MSHAPEALRVITADNPSPLTGPGTNTFLLGRASIAVIDPGPDLPAHRAAILAAAGPGRISHILVTHAHLDHSGGARALAQATGAYLVWVAAAIFVAAWVGQFIGHHVEGAKPSFFKDLQFLLIGPLWLLADVYRRLAIPMGPGADPRAG